ncbi:hypothetical protein BJ508DRAFT_378606 [Ascobolus immersus RN42]|uniref:Uncharacterized protein n=1 Tax=Ascobolus immersus RN42 TaxID=1160509 RepID=A0A3N4HVL8_ASCIM|nr:hypothetical protein BJ508DRAFT_378606 [Ascobolus immersus RN42]
MATAPKSIKKYPIINSINQKQRRSIVKHAHQSKHKKKKEEGVRGMARGKEEEEEEEGGEEKLKGTRDKKGKTFLVEEKRRDMKGCFISSSPAKVASKRKKKQGRGKKLVGNGRNKATENVPANVLRSPKSNQRPHP